ncbi:MAG: hypothetical protein HS108_03335 [Planctomycetes bacterium]|jgi:hypothetical protein|nr:hypothetical protein [Planctomycetota bacterium]
MRVVAPALCAVLALALVPCRPCAEPAEPQLQWAPEVNALLQTCRDAALYSIAGHAWLVTAAADGAALWRLDNGKAHAVTTPDGKPVTGRAIAPCFDFGSALVAVSDTPDGPRRLLQLQADGAVILRDSEGRPAVIEAGAEIRDSRYGRHSVVSILKPETPARHFVAREGVLAPVLGTDGKPLLGDNLYWRAAPDGALYVSTAADDDPCAYRLVGNAVIRNPEPPRPQALKDTRLVITRLPVPGATLVAAMEQLTAATHLWLAKDGTAVPVQTADGPLPAFDDYYLLEVGGVPCIACGTAGEQPRLALYVFEDGKARLLGDADVAAHWVKNAGIGLPPALAVEDRRRNQTWYVPESGKLVPVRLTAGEVFRPSPRAAFVWPAETGCCFDLMDPGATLARLEGSRLHWLKFGTAPVRSSAPLTVCGKDLFLVAAAQDGKGKVLCRVGPGGAVVAVDGPENLARSAAIQIAAGRGALWVLTLAETARWQAGYRNIG